MAPVQSFYILYTLPTYFLDFRVNCVGYVSQLSHKMYGNYFRGTPQGVHHVFNELYSIPFIADSTSAENFTLNGVNVCD